MGWVKGNYGKMRPRRTKDGYRSVAERKFCELLTESDIDYEYEPKEGKLPYVLHKKYLPDVVLRNGIVIEFKGYFDPEDRAKIKAVLRDNPFVYIRFVFCNSRNKLSKTKKRFPVTYGDFCDKEGIQYLCERRDSREVIIETVKRWSEEV